MGHSGQQILKWLANNIYFTPKLNFASLGEATPSGTKIVASISLWEFIVLRFGARLRSSSKSSRAITGIGSVFVSRESLGTSSPLPSTRGIVFLLVLNVRLDVEVIFGD